MSEESKEIQLRTLVAGLPEAKAALREFVDAAKAAGAEVAAAQKAGAQQAAATVEQIDNRAAQTREAAASATADALLAIENRTAGNKIEVAKQAQEKIAEINNRTEQQQVEADNKATELIKKAVDNKIKGAEAAAEKVAEIEERAEKKQTKKDTDAAESWQDKVSKRVKGVEKQAFSVTDAITGLIGKAAGVLGLLTLAWEAAKFVYELAAGAQRELGSEIEAVTKKLAEQNARISDLLGAADKLAAANGLLTAELTAQERLDVTVRQARQVELTQRLTKLLEEEAAVQFKINAARAQGAFSGRTADLATLAAEREKLAFELRGLQAQNAALVQTARRREGLDVVTAPTKPKGAPKIKKQEEDILSNLRETNAEFIKRLGLFDGADARFSASQQAYDAFLKQGAEREALLLREAEALQSILDKYNDLTAADKARLTAERDSKLAQLPADTQVAFQGRVDSKALADAQASAAEGGLLAFVGETDPAKLLAIGDALHAGIVSPLAIATQTAGDFGAAMSDAAAAAILEGKSIKEATNGILKQIARRALANAIFHAAAALGSLAFLDFRGAALHGKAAATFGIVAALGAAGAAATGGLREGTADTPAPRGVETPRTLSDRGTAPVVNQTFYISQTGLRNRAEDYAFVIGLVNEGASLEGAQRFDSRTQSAGAV